MLLVRVLAHCSALLAAIHPHARRRHPDLQEAANRPAAATTPPQGSASGPQHDPAFLATLSPAALVATNPFLPGTSSLPESLSHHSPVLPDVAIRSECTPALASAGRAGTGQGSGSASRSRDSPTLQPGQPQVASTPAQPTPSATNLPPPVHEFVPAPGAHPTDGVEASHAATAERPSVVPAQSAYSEEQVSNDVDGVPAWQPSQMQSLAAAALASARSGAAVMPGPASTLSDSFDAADALSLSQDMLDKPRACGGSTVLGAWEEEAALAALQSSREASQRSAQQQAQDAAQRAAEAMRAQHEAEAQALQDMLPAEAADSPRQAHGADAVHIAEDAAEADGIIPDGEWSSRGGQFWICLNAAIAARGTKRGATVAVCGWRTSAGMHAGGTWPDVDRFRGAGSSSGGTQDTIEDRGECSSSPAATRTGSSARSPARSAASPPAHAGRAAPSMAPLPLSPISTSPSQRPGSPAALPAAPAAGGRPSQHAVAGAATQGAARPPTRMPLPLVLSPTQPRRPPALRHAPAQQDAMPTAPGAADGTQPSAKRRLRLGGGGTADDVVVAAGGSVDRTQPLGVSPRVAAEPAEAAAGKGADPPAALLPGSQSQPRHSSASDHIAGTAAAGHGDIQGEGRAEGAWPGDPQATRPAAVPDSPLSIRGIGFASADTDHLPALPSNGLRTAGAAQHAEGRAGDHAWLLSPQPWHAGGGGREPAAAASSPPAGADAPPMHGTLAQTIQAAQESAALPGGHEEPQRDAEAVQPVHSMFRLWGLNQRVQPPLEAVVDAAARTSPQTLEGPEAAAGGKAAAEERGLEGRGRPRSGRRVRLQVREKKALRPRTAARAARTPQQLRRASRRPLPLPDSVLRLPGAGLSS